MKEFIFWIAIVVLVFITFALAGYLPDQKKTVDLPDGRCAVEVHEVNSLFSADYTDTKVMCEQNVVPVPE